MRVTLLAARGGSACLVTCGHLRHWPAVLARGDDPPEPPEARP